MRGLLIGLCSTFLTACMVGPDFQPPPSPHTSAYTPSYLPMHTVSTQGKAGVSQSFIFGEELRLDWWRLYHSPALNNLIEQGLQHNPTLAQAKASLRQAQWNLKSQFGALLLPALNGQFSGVRQRFSQEEFGSPTGSSVYNLFNSSLNLSYNIDLWGGARRQLEGLQAQVDYNQYELMAAYLTLTANIVTTAIQSASYRAQIKATEKLIKDAGYQLSIMQEQFKLGAIALDTVLSQQTFLSQTKATLPPLKNSLAHAKHALATLTGTLPSNAQIPDFNLSALTLPNKLPLSVPSTLVRKRPDILAAEALLHAAYANVGVTTANLFPQLNITSAYGFESIILGHLGKPINNIWSYGTSLSQTLFNGGALVAARKAALAALDASYAQYRQTVLSAFQNVADTLRTIEFDAKTYKEELQAEEAAHKNFNLTREQYHLGAVNYLTLLTVEQQYQQTLIRTIQAEAARYADTAALFQALGGGVIQCHTHCIKI